MREMFQVQVDSHTPSLGGNLMEILGFISLELAHLCANDLFGAGIWCCGLKEVE
jgi:hypothetical protein